MVADAFVEAFDEVGADPLVQEAFDDGDIAVLHAAGVPFEALVCFQNLPRLFF